MHIVGEDIMGQSRLDELIVPHKLNRGDTIALISLSGGRAGDEDLLPRYDHYGKCRFHSSYSYDSHSYGSEM